MEVVDWVARRHLRQAGGLTRPFPSMLADAAKVCLAVRCNKKAAARQGLDVGSQGDGPSWSPRESVREAGKAKPGAGWGGERLVLPFLRLWLAADAGTAQKGGVWVRVNQLSTIRAREGLDGARNVRGMGEVDARRLAALQRRFAGLATVLGRPVQCNQGDGSWIGQPLDTTTAKGQGRHDGARRHGVLRRLAPSGFSAGLATARVEASSIGRAGRPGVESSVA